MKRILIVLSVLLMAALSAGVALAESYTVQITVDGKPLVLTVNVNGDVVTVESGSTDVNVNSVTKIGPAASVTATAAKQANLRGGPGTTFAAVGSVTAGQPLALIGRNSDSSWYQLNGGAWIAGFLVANAPSGLPDTSTVVNAIAPAQQPTAAPPPPTATPVPAPQTQTQNCDPSYPTVCIPPPPPDLDCGDIPYRQFQVIGADPHRFDGDRDGIGCER